MTISATDVKKNLLPYVKVIHISIKAISICTPVFYNLFNDSIKFGYIGHNIALTLISPVLNTGNNTNKKFSTSFQHLE